MNEESSRIFEKIGRTVSEYGMLPPAGRLIVGVSGGADSMLLLSYLMRAAGKDRITAAHVNHGIRGEEADRDELFVKRFCEENEIVFACLHADIPAMARDAGKGEEECGREVRYGYFASLAPGENDRIYTAHTLSDSCETVLMRLVSGTGVGGLKGISPVRGKIMRPLISLTRDEVERCCKALSLSYCTDSTNLSDAYTRNFLRLRVIPLLKEQNPAFEEAVRRLSQAAGEDDAYLCALAAQAAESGSVPAWQALPSPVLRRALRIKSEKAGCGRMDSLHLIQAEELVRAGRGQLSLPGGRLLLCESGRLFFLNEKERAAPFSMPYREPGVLLPDGRTLRIEAAERIPQKCANIHNLFATDTIPCGIIMSEISVRSRKEGDTILLPRRKIRKKLKKLQQEMGIPAHLRDRCAVLEWRGEILWAEGVGASGRFSVTENTKHAAMVRISEI